VGLTAKSTEEDRQNVCGRTNEYFQLLSQAGVRAHLDDRSEYSPGFKFNHWEMKGVPMRIEVGPKDIEKGAFVMAKRNIADPKACKVFGKHDSMVKDVQDMLETIHNELYLGALKDRDDKLAWAGKWEEFSPNLNKGMLVLVPFC